MAAEYSEAGTKWELMKGAKRVHSGLAISFTNCVTNCVRRAVGSVGRAHFPSSAVRVPYPVCPLSASASLGYQGGSMTGLFGLPGAKLQIKKQPDGQQNQGKAEQADLQPSGEVLDPSDRHPYDHSRDDENHPDGIEGLILGSLRLVLLECKA
jgi:hypothetical protein